MIIPRERQPWYKSPYTPVEIDAARVALNLESASLQDSEVAKRIHHKAEEIRWQAKLKDWLKATAGAGPEERAAVKVFITRSRARGENLV